MEMSCTSYFKYYLCPTWQFILNKFRSRYMQAFKALFSREQIIQRHVKKRSPNHYKTSRLIRNHCHKGAENHFDLQ